jgi:hypothetical protein
MSNFLYKYPYVQNYHFKQKYFIQFYAALLLNVKIEEEYIKLDAFRYSTGTGTFPR